MVNAWWVTIMNLVEVIFVNSFRRLQNLVTFASSSGASTSSNTQIGEGLVKNTANIKDNAVKGAISSYELLKNSNVEISKKDVLDRMQKNPADLDCKMNYSKILFKENNFSECIDVLLEMFRKDKEWKDGYAKKQLLLIFDHLGSENELSKKGRRALTSLIFV